MNRIQALFILPSAFAFIAFACMGQDRSITGDSRKFRLCPVKEVKSSAPPMDSGRFGPALLIDGKLPDNGWRSTWTSWMKKNPSLVFDLNGVRRIGIIRIYFQAWDRVQELSKVKVEVSLDDQKYLLFNEYVGFVAEKEKGSWAEIDLKAVKARYFRITPSYDGWGNQWGEVEFWEIVN